MEAVEGRPLDEQELIERARNGDSGAYAELVGRHEQVAFRVAWVAAGNAADAADAAQEAFVKAYYALDRFRDEAPFRPWLLTIVANEARNRRRSAARRERLAARAATVRPPGDAAPSPEEAAVASEQRRSLLAAIEELRPKDREIIAYRYLLELSEAETAAALGVARGTAKSRLSRALQRLRALLEKSEQEAAQ